MIQVFFFQGCVQYFHILVTIQIFIFGEKFIGTTKSVLSTSFYRMQQMHRISGPLEVFLRAGYVTAVIFMLFYNTDTTSF